MSNLRGPELLIILVILVLVFGARRMPDAARSLGRSLRIFRTETKGLLDGEPDAPVPPAVGGPVTAVTGIHTVPDPEMVTEAVPQNPAVPPTARK